MGKKYFTQMEAARKNIITPEMEKVAVKEDRPVEFIREKVANGTIVIPANPLHK
ncbi:MAG: phosphomethylpyrimidine synthase ThiC, partial [Acidaminococcaceae bacterium]|nr:phosphomethylpyrimidine synthase ThiC [Acidaminococcaceae bacterium]